MQPFHATSLESNIESSGNCKKRVVAQAGEANATTLQGFSTNS